MRGRIGAGVAGWLAALAPLVIANLATYLGYLSFDEAVLAGTLGLLGSILLGGLVAGVLGGRDSGGARGGIVAGGISAVLYVISVLALNTGVSLADSSTPQILTNPIPACMTVIFCAALLLSVAALAGTLAGGRAGSRRSPAGQRAMRTPAERGSASYGAPARPSQYPPFSQQPAPRAAPPTIPRRDWDVYDDAPRAPYDRSGSEGDERLRTQGRRPADVMSRPSGYRQGSARDGYDRYGDRRD